MTHAPLPSAGPQKQIPTCIYKTAFLDHVKALGTGLSASVIVYGPGEGSLDATTAADKLPVAGLPHVEPFEGGLAAWKAAGLPLKGTGQLPQPTVPDGPYHIDTAQDVIRWTDRNLFNHHSGTERLACGCARVASSPPASPSIWPASPAKTSPIPG